MILDAQQYEYRVQTFHARSLEQRLNEWGQHGWRACAVTPLPYDLAVVVVFMRPLCCEAVEGEPGEGSNDSNATEHV